MSANAEARTSPRVGIRVIPWIVGIAYFAVGAALLHVTHPEEDAFILFKYVRNLVDGHGIVFYAGGPHAEGATDFLWLLLLASLVRAGLDVAIASCLLNAAGAWLASFLFVRAVERAGLVGRAAWVCASIPAVMLVGAPALGGYAGFSAMLYSALAALVFWMSISDAPRVVALVPLGSIALALFRPDGVVLGAALSLASLFRVMRSAAWKRWIISAAAAFVIGAAYLVWRRSYFELPLPLPLYVKSNGTIPFTLERAWSDPVHALPGLSQNLRWCLSPLGPAPFVLAALALWCGVHARERKEIVRMLVRFVPVLVFLAALACGRQTQNYAFRFQAPALMILALAVHRVATVLLATEPASTLRRVLVVGVLSLAHAPMAVAGAWHLSSRASNRSYIDVFPARLDETLRGSRVLAITEAGRLAYWTHARLEDMVGLNNPRTALRPPDLAYLRELDPDVVMFHVADTFALPDSLSPDRVAVLPLSPEVLAHAARPRARGIYEEDVTTYPAGFAPESVAPARLGRYLVESGAYEIYAVRYRGAYDHVYGIRRDLPEHAAIVDALRESTHDANWRSYAELAGFGRPRR